jgi:hypothetical protein
VQEVGGAEAATWDHIAAEVEQHGHIAALVGAIREEGGVSRKERLWEEEEGCYSTSSGDDGGQIVIPGHPIALSKETTTFSVSYEYPGRREKLPRTATCAPFVTNIV